MIDNHMYSMINIILVVNKTSKKNVAIKRFKSAGINEVGFSSTTLREVRAEVGLDSGNVSVGFHIERTSLS